MNLSELAKRIAPTSEPVFTGEWATLSFRPDLGSQQEFIIGVAASIKGDERPYVKWLPSLSRLSYLYGESISTSDLKDLLTGSETSIQNSQNNTPRAFESGTPHIKVVPCGYIATDNIDKTLLEFLHRHAGAIWAESNPKNDSMDDEWAYSAMRKIVSSVRSKIFVPNQTIQIANRSLHVDLDNTRSYGNIVSARYSTLTTVEKHINASLRRIVAAHHLSARKSVPALFVVLPETDGSVDSITIRKTSELLAELEDMGIVQFSDKSPDILAHRLEKWGEEALLG